LDTLNPEDYTGTEFINFQTFVEKLNRKVDENAVATTVIK